MGLSQLPPAGDDPVLGTYRPPPLYRLLSYATPFSAVFVVALIFGPLDVLPRPPMPFAVAFVVLVLGGSFYSLWLGAQRVVLSQDGIEQSALGTTKFVRYDEIVSIRRRRPLPFEFSDTAAFTRVGDARGTRILLTGFLSQYEIITDYIDSRIGDRKLKWCPWTGIEYFKWGMSGVVVVLFVVMMLFKDLWP